jgi:hypothetical protein
VPPRPGPESYTTDARVMDDTRACHAERPPCLSESLPFPRDAAPGRCLPAVVSLRPATLRGRRAGHCVRRDARFRFNEWRVRDARWSVGEARWPVGEARWPVSEKRCPVNERHGLISEARRPVGARGRSFRLARRPFQRGDHRFEQTGHRLRRTDGPLPAPSTAGQSEKHARSDGETCPSGGATSHRARPMNPSSAPVSQSA